MKPFGFGKPEKLKSRKAIDFLFTRGNTITVFSLRVKYCFLPPSDETAPVQAGVSVSKRAFKRAVDRNRIKRLLRETYRLHKNGFLKLVIEKRLQVNLFFIYTGKDLPTYAVIETAMRACLHSLQQNAFVYENTH